MSGTLGFLGADVALSKTSGLRVAARVSKTGQAVANADDGDGDDFDCTLTVTAEISGKAELGAAGKLQRHVIDTKALEVLPHFAAWLHMSWQYVPLPAGRQSVRLLLLWLLLLFAHAHGRCPCRHGCLRLRFSVVMPCLIVCPAVMTYRYVVIGGVGGIPAPTLSVSNAQFCVGSFLVKLAAQVFAETGKVLGPAKDVFQVLNTKVDETQYVLFTTGGVFDFSTQRLFTIATGAIIATVNKYKSMQLSSMSLLILRVDRGRVFLLQTLPPTLLPRQLHFWKRQDRAGSLGNPVRE